VIQVADSVLAGPRDCAEALAAAEAALDFLNGPARDAIGPAALGEVLLALSRIGAKYSAAWNGLLSRFDASGGHDADGCQTTASWLAHKTQATFPSARGQVKQMRQVTARPHLDDAMAEGQLSPSWAREIIALTKPLPQDMRAGIDAILLDAIARGADLEDLRMLIRQAIEAWKAGRPDPDEPGDGFAGRSLALDATFGGAGHLRGDLTAECTAALAAVLDALGKKHGADDDRSQGQRFHDALQEACELLIRAKMTPDRAGADTRVDAVISLADLLGLPGAGGIADAWLAAGAAGGHHVFLAGTAAEAVSCDALVAPVVTGGADWAAVTQIIELVAGALADHGPGGDTGGIVPPLDLAPGAWEALQHAIARLCVGFVSGPGGLASALRTGLLGQPWNSRSLPLDVGLSQSIPDAIRRAVIRRDQHCRWPGCDRRPAQSDVHHVKHKKDGGPTSVDSCVTLCQYHHDICVHRRGWTIELLPDGEVRVTSPDGRILRSHPPPPARAA